MHDEADTDRVKELIAAADLDPAVKTALSEIIEMLKSPAVLERTLQYTGAYEAANDFDHKGVAFLLDEQGNLRDINTLDFTPQTLHALTMSAQRRELAARLPAGGDLFQQLVDNPGTYPSLHDVCEAAPYQTKIDYIRAVYQALPDERNAKDTMRRMVDYATGRGGKDVNTSHSASWEHPSKDAIDIGLTRIASALHLKAKNGEQHPVIYVLEKFIRTLPQQKFDFDPPGQVPTSVPATSSVLDALSGATEMGYGIPAAASQGGWT